MVETFVCEKCKHKSVYFRGTTDSMTGICNRTNCRALYTRDLKFIDFDIENKINIHYNHDGSIELTKATIRKLDEKRTEIIQERLLDIEKRFKENMIQSDTCRKAREWWDSLSMEDKINIYRKGRLIEGS